MFHSHQFCAPVMSMFFRPHEPYDDITLDDIYSPFHPPRYPTDGESNSDSRLTLTYSVEFDPSESTYLTYSVGSYHSKPSQSSLIHLSSDSSASSASPASLSVRGCGFIHTRAMPAGIGVPEEEDVRMMHPVVSGMDALHSMVDWDSTCGADHEDSPFLSVVIGLSFSCMACMGCRDF